MNYCHKCRAAWEGFGQPGSRAVCATCGEDLHVCRNCRFYDEHKPYQCRLDVDPVQNKERANYCDEFQFADRASPRSRTDEADRAREQLKKLFKK